MSQCGQCGVAFSCGMQDTQQACWCTQLPHLDLERMPARAEGGTTACLCPTCLQAWILGQKLNGASAAD